MQGENILRTQALRQKRIEDLGGSKKMKSTTLQNQSKELKVLEVQKIEKDRVLNELKKQGKTLNNQIAAKKKQMQKVSNAIAAAIRKAQEEARREALAKAAAEEKRRKEAEKANTATAATAPSKPSGTNNGSVGTIKTATGSSVPVSYTHLDVYKRQSRCRILVQRSVCNACRIFLRKPAERKS